MLVYQTITFRHAFHKKLQHIQVMDFTTYTLLQHRSILFATLNFRTRLFYLAFIFAVLVCALFCFLIFARFVRRLISSTTRSFFAFLPSSSV